MSQSQAPSVRRLLGVLLGTLGALVVALIVLTVVQVQMANRAVNAENRRNDSFLLADQLRQTSNDLTRMVRLYVSTGDPRFRQYHTHILAIRAGTVPRPLHYDSSFWDRVLADGEESVRYGKAESLASLFRDAGIGTDELTALNTALHSSDDLAQLELDVMNRVEPRIRQGVDASYASDVAPQYARLVDDHFFAEKARIMGSIKTFTDLVDRRTLASVEHQRAIIRNLFVVQLLVLLGVVVVGIRSVQVVRRRALGPLDDLVGSTERIAHGEYDERTQAHGVRELEDLAASFNQMADAVEADVAARQLAEQEAVVARQAAEHASKAKSEFLASTSHEIRTPLIGVTGMLEVLAQTDLTPEQRGQVGTAQASAATLLQIIGDTLDFSKIEAGKLELASSTFAVRDVVDAAVTTFRDSASAKGLLLVATVEDDIAAAHVGDPLRVRQILSNFISNSVKFTEAGGIELTARAVGEPSEGAQAMELSVTDTGIGLTEVQQQRLFSEFAQAEATTAQRFGGTGLGLVICRRLALLMGGDVTMHSALGEGTTMTLAVTLPVGDPDEVVPESTFSATRFVSGRSAPSREEAIAERSLVLVAEDHSVNRAVILHQLGAIGCCADAVSDGQEALDAYATGDYSLVLTDIHMPRLDGYELAEAIRALEAERGWARVPIVALTASTLVGDLQRCMDAGMDDHAAKPTTIPFLATKVGQWLPHVSFSAVPVAPDPPAVLAATLAVIDPSVLDEVAAGDEGMRAEILRTFAESAVEDLGQVDAAFAAGDLAAVASPAHRLKGSAAVVGALEVNDVSARLEQLAKAGDANGEAQTLRDELAAAVDRVRAEVSEGSS